MIALLRIWLRLMKRLGGPAAALLVLSATTARASFDEVLGTRAGGMAETGVAIAEDADAPTSNPAGLVQVRQGQMNTELGEQDRGLNDGSSLQNTYVGLAQPLKTGDRVIGVGYNNFNAQGILSERTLLLGLGQRLSIEPFGWRGVWSVGGNLKQLHREFSSTAYTGNAVGDAGAGTGQSDPVFRHGLSVDAYAVDVGGLYQFGPALRTSIGAAIMNANRPNLSLAGSSDRAPFIAKAGIAHRPDWGLLSVEVRRAHRLAGAADSEFALGAERRLRLDDFGALVLRGGYAEGSRNYREATLGFSYHFGRFHVDYAFQFPLAGLSDTAGSHRLGFGFKFGGESAAPQSATSTAFDRDLLSALVSDSRTSYVVMKRGVLAGGGSVGDEQDLVRLLLRRYALDDAGLAPVSDEIRRAVAGGTVSDWTAAKQPVLASVEAARRAAANDALDLWAAGRDADALPRFAEATSSAGARGLFRSAYLMALAAPTAQAVRADDLDVALAHVGTMLSILPGDQPILDAYHALLSRRADREASHRSAETELPEAPASLTAPHPAIAPAAESASPLEAKMKAYGIALGTYFARKAAGASDEERLEELRRMKAEFDGSGLDTTLVDREYAAVKSAVDEKANALAAPTPAPAAMPAPIPVALHVSTSAAAPARHAAHAKARSAAKKKIVVHTATRPAGHRPAASASPTPKAAAPRPIPSTAAETRVSGLRAAPAIRAGWERAWTFYEDVVRRDISDAERLEILDEIVKRYPGPEAEKARVERERVLKRLR